MSELMQTIGKEEKSSANYLKRARLDIIAHTLAQSEDNIISPKITYYAGEIAHLVRKVEKYHRPDEVVGYAVGKLTFERERRDYQYLRAIAGRLAFVNFGLAPEARSILDASRQDHEGIFDEFNNVASYGVSTINEEFERLLRAETVIESDAIANRFGNRYILRP